MRNVYRVFLMWHRQSRNRTPLLRRGKAILAVSTLAGILAGCTSQLADLAEPANTPARPAVAPAYPAVNDMPAPRDTKPLSAEESKRIADELSAARARQQAETENAPPPPPPPGPPATPEQSRGWPPWQQ